MLSLLLSVPVRRGALGLILVAVVLFPSGTSGHHRRSCPAGRCSADGAISWSRPLAGSWLAENGIQGTVYAQGQAYAAVGSGVAAVGYGLTLDAFDAATGFPRWAATLGGVPAGSSIISVRVWPGVVTAGVQVVANSGSNSIAAVGGNSGSGSDGGVLRSGEPTIAGRKEFVLNAVTGKQLRVYPAAWFGGAVSADLKSSVIVGARSVASYANRTGKVRWRIPTGAGGQAWQVSGNDLYVTVSATGPAGTAPVTAVREINLRNGAQRLIQPAGRSFDGRLSGVLDDELLFSSADGLRMYSGPTGGLTGFRAGAVPEMLDSVQEELYVDVGGALIGIDPVTGKDERGTSYPGPPGTYGVRDGVALGLDPGAKGAAWGYNIARKHVIWTSRSLPWPHFFVDLSGLGGSSDPSSDAVLLVTCAKVGQRVRSAEASVAEAGAAPADDCLRPMLVAIER
ncbi:MAG TPA: hypothetical protein VFQ44_26105 [Streptosporangiaceae bacterium]|nr:hypothetical protein [Streptosporangiaceae bacterium]